MTFYLNLHNACKDSLKYEITRHCTVLCEVTVGSFYVTLLGSEIFATKQEKYKSSLKSKTHLRLILIQINDLTSH